MSTGSVENDAAQFTDTPSSIKSTRLLCSSLEATLEVAKPLRLKLAQWYKDLDKEGLSSGNHRKPHDLNGEGSLHLAYITAKIELFRAMLRPKGEANAPAGHALRQGAISLAKEMFEFVESLNASHLEAFWPSCKSCLCPCLFYTLSNMPQILVPTSLLRATSWFNYLRPRLISTTPTNAYICSGRGGVCFASNPVAATC